MAQHEVTRTLVKSQPEVWAQCSVAESLERHLSGSFGEIRITRLDPEHSVAWEGEQVRGTVRIEPSAWGTRVTLAVQLEHEDESEMPGPLTAAASVEAKEPGEASLPAQAAGLAESEVEETAPLSEPEADDVTLPNRSEESTAPPAAVVGAADSIGPAKARPPGRFGRWWGRFRRGSAPQAALAAVSQAPASDEPGAPGREHSEAFPEEDPRALADAIAPPDAIPAPDAIPEPDAIAAPEAIAPPESPSVIEESPLPTEARAAKPPSAGSSEPQSDAAAALSAALESMGQAHHRPYSRA